MMGKNEKLLKISNEKLGFYAKLVLKITIPLVLIQALGLVFFVLSTDTYELFSSLDVMWGITEAVLVSLALSVGGCLLTDALEREKSKK